MGFAFNFVGWGMRLAFTLGFVYTLVGDLVWVLGFYDIFVGFCCEFWLVF